MVGQRQEMVGTGRWLMARVFHPRFNTISRLTLVAVVLFFAVLAWASLQLERSSWVTGVGIPREQPVPFSHEHHVRGLGIDCRYCHSTVEVAPTAGMPSTKVCMTCHSRIWTGADMLEPVRESWRSGQPLQWQRVHNLPNFVYFDHSIHIQKGVGCSTCHGRVDRMPLIEQAASLQMEWCLTCHREPERFLRPREKVFDMDYEPPVDQARLGQELAQQVHLLPPQLMQNCSLCHR